MCNVVTHDVFLRKKMQREYDRIMDEYRNYPYPVLNNTALEKISTFPNVKALVFHDSMDGTIDSFTLYGREIFDRFSNVSYDYTFLSDSLLRLTVSKYVWMDVYFADALPQAVIDDLIFMMESDDINNFSIMSENHNAVSSLYDELVAINSEYMRMFNESILERV